MPEPLWIGEAQAAELLTVEDAIDVLEAAYAAQAEGRAQSMRRAHVREGDAILHAVGGTLDGVAGTKTWLYTPGGAEPLLVLFDLAGGRVIGIVEAFAMGQLRTAATSGLGTRRLARADARTLALLGTGKQAFSQAEAVLAVRPIEAIRLFGREPSRRARLAERLRALGVRVSEHGDPAEAIAGADVVTTITRAAEPFVTAAMLAPGMHVNAVGAIVPSRRELTGDAVARFDHVVVDSLPQAREDAAELRGADWAAVRALCDPAPRRARDDLTLFKALGVGLSDVALGAELVRRATTSITKGAVHARG